MIFIVMKQTHALHLATKPVLNLIMERRGRQKARLSGEDTTKLAEISDFGGREPVLDLLILIF